jgi:hypothetical protein
MSSSQSPPRVKLSASPQHRAVSFATTMSNLRAYCTVLLREVDPDITSWDYSVVKLPQAKQTNEAGLVKCLSLISSDSKTEFVLRFESAPSNRVTCKEPLDKLLLVSLANFRLRWPAISPDAPPRLATGRENGDYITRLLTTGVRLNGIHYHFFGHSNNQLKSRSCFLYAASKEEISVKIEAMGDLSKLKSVGKKAKRIGLLFSHFHRNAAKILKILNAMTTSSPMDVVSYLLNSRINWSRVAT